MPNGRRLNRLLIDDLTYLPLQRSRLPLHRHAFEFEEMPSSALAAYLVSRGSDGVVISCQNMPADFRILAVQSGPVCALSRSALAKLASP